MIKVICIDDSRPSEITLNKIYDAEPIGYNRTSVTYYRLINDNGIKSDYYFHRFELLSDWREQQIKTVLDD